MINRLLIIDGNYFANRCIGILNQKENHNDIITDEEKTEFLQGLQLQLIKLWKSLNPYFDNFIFVFDNNSWRKQLSFQPYYITSSDIDEGIKIGYKEQRVSIREESSIDYNNFHIILRQFRDDLNKLNNVYESDSLEGDDILAFLTKIYSKNDIETCIFCTDKDLLQLVNDKCFVFRNTRSKQHPNGSFCLSKEMYDKYIRQTTNYRELLLPKSNESLLFKDLMSLDLFEDDNKVIRQLNSGIELSEKYRLIINKVISGDSSDNIFPIIRWKSSTGKINYKPTEKHINQALTRLFRNPSEEVYKELIESPVNNESLFKDFIFQLMMECKIIDTNNFDSILEHFIYNERLIILNKSNFPQELVDKFFLKYEPQHFINVMNNKISVSDLETLFNVDKHRLNDRMANLLKDSIM